MSDAKVVDRNMRPSQDICDENQAVFDHLNWRLFDDELPNCAINLQRRKNSDGYFISKSFERRDRQNCDEIVLNPDSYDPDNPELMLSIFARQMVSLWQYNFGSPGKRHYHNRQWADKIKSIGLQSASGNTSGPKETGYKIQHSVIEGGLFEEAARELLNKGFAFTWISAVARNEVNSESIDADNRKKSEEKSGKRVLYACPVFHECGQSARSKHDASLKCGIHNLPMPPSASIKSLNP